jgi:long-chain acyl-CoA synthetase
MSVNLAHLLARSARAFPDLAAVYVGSAQHATFQQLAGRSARCARALRSDLGLAAGDRVALVMKNCPQYVELLFALWHAGLCAVPINAKLHPREIGYILEDSGARLCFVTADLEPFVDAVATGDMARVVTVDSERYDMLFAAAPAPIAEIGAEDLAWLFYTSGTTGRPKGVMLSHGNLLAMTLRYFSDVDSVAPGDCIVHAAPMSHGSGLYLLPHVAQAAAQVIPLSGGFDADELCGLVAAHRGVSLFAAPTMVKRLVDHINRSGAEVKNLKTLIYGGGPMYLEDCLSAIGCFGPKLAQIYGQGESPMTITALPRQLTARAYAEADMRCLSSVGLPSTGIEVRIVSTEVSAEADADDRPLPIGEAGEVLVRGDTVMRGYWNNPQASAETLRGGWLHTGDIGCFDERGYLTLKDRSKDVIISGGSNIYPREVEEALLAHPAVAEVSVIGRRHSDWGEEVVACVVRRPGAAVDEAELDRLCLERIARFKRPKTYVFVDELPKNSTGKVLKTALRGLLVEPAS